MQQKSLNLCKLYGFGIIKNGIKFDFPFRESVLSFRPLVDKVYYILGDSSDSTDVEFEKFDFCKTEKSTWDISVKDGIVISIETNKALCLLRNSVDTKEAWGIYLQADEVLHQDDYQIIKDDIVKATSEGCDAISFRYLHFWQSHHRIAISKRWYPHEIRAIKLDSDIISWGDGQSFKNQKKVYASEARIYHYGHIREAKAYNQKMKFQSSFHFKGFRYYRKRFESRRNELLQKSIPYFGTHPLVMKERIEKMNETWELPQVDCVYIVGDKKNYSNALIESINSKKNIWVKKMSDIPLQFRDQAIITNPSSLDYFFNRTRVRDQMDSSLATKWSVDFRLVLQLSEKLIGLKNIK